jgi:hypothetical protein
VSGREHAHEHGHAHSFDTEDEAAEEPLGGERRLTVATPTS